MQEFESVPVSNFIKLYNHSGEKRFNPGKDPVTGKPLPNPFEAGIQNNQALRNFYIESPMYVLKTAEIFPFDLHINTRAVDGAVKHKEP